MRYEYKYVVPISVLGELRKRVTPFLVHDANMAKGGSQGYTVRSIYFDTPGYDYYSEKVEGFRKRKKVRIRGYNDHSTDKPVFLEIKMKDQKKVSKHRSAVKYGELATFLATGDSERFILPKMGSKFPIDASERFMFHMKNAFLMPVVLVVYDREAYFGKFDSSLRMTFDKNLRGMILPELCHLYQNSGLTPSVPNHFIFEVKFNDIFPMWLKSINTSLGITLGSFSKYTTCIDEQMFVRPGRRHLYRACVQA